MRILLLGEFSSLHKYLKEGLQAIGVEAVLASSGDTWKKIGGADIVIPTCNNGLKRYYDQYIAPFFLLDKFSGYDVVQYISPVLFSSFNNKFIFDYIRKSSKCLSLVSAGTDYSLIKAYKKGVFDYYMMDYDKIPLDRFDINTRRGRSMIMNNEHIEKNVDIIIPSLYEYTFEHLGNHSHSVIPFPINTDNLEYRDNKVRKKIVFFHGLNREAAKGTPFIREALERLRFKYPNDVEIIIDGHMPFDRYMDAIHRSNVVVDQCCSYGYGINACISMSQGKVVMAGARKETLDAFRITESPIINIIPSVDQIYGQLENILENRNKIVDMGEASRKYVEDLHNYKKVACQYIDAWKSTGKI